MENAAYTERQQHLDRHAHVLTERLTNADTDHAAFLTEMFYIHAKLKESSAALEKQIDNQATLDLQAMFGVIGVQDAFDVLNRDHLAADVFHGTWWETNRQRISEMVLWVYANASESDALMNTEKQEIAVFLMQVLLKGTMAYYIQPHIPSSSVIPQCDMVGEFLDDPIVRAVHTVRGTRTTSAVTLLVTTLGALRECYETLAKLDAKQLTIADTHWGLCVPPFMKMYPDVWVMLFDELKNDYDKNLVDGAETENHPSDLFASITWGVAQIRKVAHGEYEPLSGLFYERVRALVIPSSEKVTYSKWKTIMQAVATNENEMQTRIPFDWSSVMPVIVATSERAILASLQETDAEDVAFVRECVLRAPDLTRSILETILDHCFSPSLVLDLEVRLQILERWFDAFLVSDYFSGETLKFIDTIRGKEDSFLQKTLTSARELTALVRDNPKNRTIWHRHWRNLTANNGKTRIHDWGLKDANNTAKQWLRARYSAEGVETIAYPNAFQRPARELDEALNEVENYAGISKQVSEFEDAVLVTSPTVAIPQLGNLIDRLKSVNAASTFADMRAVYTDLWDESITRIKVTLNNPPPDMLTEYAALSPSEMSRLVRLSEKYDLAWNGVAVQERMILAEVASVPAPTSVAHAVEILAALQSLCAHKATWAKSVATKVEARLLEMTPQFKQSAELLLVPWAEWKQNAPLLADYMTTMDKVKKTFKVEFDKHLLLESAASACIRDVGGIDFRTLDDGGCKTGVDAVLQALSDLVWLAEVPSAMSGNTVIATRVTLLLAKLDAIAQRARCSAFAAVLEADKAYQDGVLSTITRAANKASVKDVGRVFLSLPVQELCVIGTDIVLDVPDRAALAGAFGSLCGILDRLCAYAKSRGNLLKRVPSAEAKVQDLCNRFSTVYTGTHAAVLGQVLVDDQPQFSRLIRLATDVKTTYQADFPIDEFRYAVRNSILEIHKQIKADFETDLVMATDRVCGLLDNLLAMMKDTSQSWQELHVVPYVDKMWQTIQDAYVRHPPPTPLSDRLFTSPEVLQRLVALSTALQQGFNCVASVDFAYEHVIDHITTLRPGSNADNAFYSSWEKVGTICTYCKSWPQSALECTGVQSRVKKAGQVMSDAAKAITSLEGIHIPYMGVSSYALRLYDRFGVRLDVIGIGAHMLDALISSASVDVRTTLTEALEILSQMDLVVDTEQTPRKSAGITWTASFLSVCKTGPWIEACTKQPLDIQDMSQKCNLIYLQLDTWKVPFATELWGALLTSFSGRFTVFAATSNMDAPYLWLGALADFVDKSSTPVPACVAVTCDAIAAYRRTFKKEWSEFTASISGRPILDTITTLMGIFSARSVDKISSISPFMQLLSEAAKEDTIEAHGKQRILGAFQQQLQALAVAHSQPAALLAPNSTASASSHSDPSAPGPVESDMGEESPHSDIASQNASLSPPTADPDVSATINNAPAPVLLHAQPLAAMTADTASAPQIQGNGDLAMQTSSVSGGGSDSDEESLGVKEGTAGGISRIDSAGESETEDAGGVVNDANRSTDSTQQGVPASAANSLDRRVITLTGSAQGASQPTVVEAAKKEDAKQKAKEERKQKDEKKKQKRAEKKKKKEAEKKKKEDEKKKKREEKKQKIPERTKSKKRATADPLEVDAMPEAPPVFFDPVAASAEPSDVTALQKATQQEVENAVHKAASAITKGTTGTELAQIEESITQALRDVPLDQRTAIMDHITELFQKPEMQQMLNIGNMITQLSRLDEGESDLAPDIAEFVGSTWKDVFANDIEAEGKNAALIEATITAMQHIAHTRKVEYNRITTELYATLTTNRSALTPDAIRAQIVALHGILYKQNPETALARVDEVRTLVQASILATLMPVWSYLQTYVMLESARVFRVWEEQFRRVDDTTDLPEIQVPSEDEVSRRAEGIGLLNGQFPNSIRSLFEQGRKDAGTVTSANRIASNVGSKVICAAADTKWKDICEHLLPAKRDTDTPTFISFCGDVREICKLTLSECAHVWGRVAHDPAYTKLQKGAPDIEGDVSTTAQEFHAIDRAAIDALTSLNGMQEAVTEIWASSLSDLEQLNSDEFGKHLEESSKPDTVAAGESSVTQQKKKQISSLYENIKEAFKIVDGRKEVGVSQPGMRIVKVMPTEKTIEDRCREKLAGFDAFEVALNLFVHEWERRYCEAVTMLCTLLGEYAISGLVCITEVREAVQVVVDDMVAKIRHKEALSEMKDVQAQLREKARETSQNFYVMEERVKLTEAIEGLQRLREKPLSTLIVAQGLLADTFETHRAPFLQKAGDTLCRIYQFAQNVWSTSRQRELAKWAIFPEPATAVQHEVVSIAKTEWGDITDTSPKPGKILANIEAACYAYIKKEYKALRAFVDNDPKDTLGLEAICEWIDAQNEGVKKYAKITSAYDPHADFKQLVERKRAQLYEKQDDILVRDSKFHTEASSLLAYLTNPLTPHNKKYEQTKLLKLPVLKILADITPELRTAREQYTLCGEFRRMLQDVFREAVTTVTNGKFNEANYLNRVAKEAISRGMQGMVESSSDVKPMLMAYTAVWTHFSKINEPFLAPGPKAEGMVFGGEMYDAIMFARTLPAQNMPSSSVAPLDVPRSRTYPLLLRAVQLVHSALYRCDQTAATMMPRLLAVAANSQILRAISDAIQKLQAVVGKVKTNAWKPFAILSSNTPFVAGSSPPFAQVGMDSGPEESLLYFTAMGSLRNYYSGRTPTLTENAGRLNLADGWRPTLTNMTRNKITLNIAEYEAYREWVYYQEARFLQGVKINRNFNTTWDARTEDLHTIDRCSIKAACTRTAEAYLGTKLECSEMAEQLCMCTTTDQTVLQNEDYIESSAIRNNLSDISDMVRLKLDNDPEQCEMIQFAEDDDKIAARLATYADVVQKRFIYTPHIPNPAPFSKPHDMFDWYDALESFVQDMPTRVRELQEALRQHLTTSTDFYVNDALKTIRRLRTPVALSPKDNSRLQQATASVAGSAAPALASEEASAKDGAVLSGTKKKKSSSKKVGVYPQSATAATNTSPPQDPPKKFLFGLFGMRDLRSGPLVNEQCDCAFVLNSLLLSCDTFDTVAYAFATHMCAVHGSAPPSIPARERLASVVQQFCDTLPALHLSTWKDLYGNVPTPM
jgi:hypothetical protein